MLSLYEQFINEKYNIYLAKIGIKDELLKKRLKITVDQDHQHVAESLIINSDQWLHSGRPKLTCLCIEKIVNL